MTSKDQRNEYARKYYQENRERLCAYRREWNRKNPDKAYIHRQKNRLKHLDARREYAHQHYLIHRNEILEKQRKYISEHPEEIRKRNRRYKEENREYITQSMRTYFRDFPYIQKAEHLAQRLVPLKAGCETCHSTKNLQRHHPDYTQPLLVRTLCASCHNKLKRTNLGAVTQRQLQPLTANVQLL